MTERRRAPRHQLEVSVTELRRASREVLERLAMAVDARPHTGKGSWAWPPEVHEALDAYRASTAPLRTRAEVDAEIVRTVRSCGESWWKSRGIESVAILVGEDCFEPTTDSGSSSATAAKESRDNAGVSAGPAKEPEALPWDAEDQKLADSCSCDEALELRRVIKHVHSLALEMARVTEGA